MRTWLLASLLLLSVSAQATDSPIPPAVERRLTVDIAGSRKNLVRRAKVIYDAAAKGGASTAAIDLGLSLPANSLILNGQYYINTAFVDNGAGTYQWKCGSTALQATAFDYAGLGAGGFRSVGAGYSTGQFTDVGTSSCALTMQTGLSTGSGTFAVTAGKATLFLEYIVP